VLTNSSRAHQLNRFLRHKYSSCAVLSCETAYAARVFFHHEHHWPIHQVSIGRVHIEDGSPLIWPILVGTDAGKLVPVPLQVERIDMGKGQRFGLLF
jgi:hypothetical protein